MSRKKILVADDSRTALFLVTTMLKREPYDLIIAGDGRQAVELAAEERPALILMDVLMPGQTGFDACRELKQREDTSSIPVILVTAGGQNRDREALLASGCDGFLSKPINADELLAKLRDLLPASEEG